MFQSIRDFHKGTNINWCCLKLNEMFLYISNMV